MIQADFDDFDEFAEKTKVWRVGYRQLDCGPFRGSLTQIVRPAFNLTRVRWSRLVEQEGEPPRGMRTICLGAAPEGACRWRRQRFSGRCLSVFPEGSELSAVSPPGFGAVTFSVAPALLDSEARRLGLPSLDDILGGREILTCDPSAVAALRQGLATIMEDFSGHRAQAALDGGEAFGRHIAGLYLRALSTANTVQPRVAPSPRYERSRVMRKARAYIEDNAVEAITVEELTRAIGANERTLRRAFLDEFGLSPKAYLRARRLNGVRRALRHGSIAETRVADIANEWGFWHMGQFAKDYRQLFGELPSATLR